MNKKKKKLFAREFLILIGTIVLALFVVLLFKSLSEYSIKKVERLEISIFKISATSTDLYQLTKKGEFKSKKDFVNYVENNSVDEIYLKIMDGAFSSLTEFKEFVPEYAKESKTELSEKITQIESEIKKTENSFYYKLNEDFFALIVLICFSLSFAMRYLYYGIKWSLKILKEDD